MNRNAYSAQKTNIFQNNINHLSTSFNFLGPIFHLTSLYQHWSINNFLPLFLAQICCQSQIILILSLLKFSAFGERVFRFGYWRYAFKKTERISLCFAKLSNQLHGKHAVQHTLRLMLLLPPACVTQQPYLTSILWLSSEFSPGRLWLPTYTRAVSHASC
jgi:hypothetical protein